MKKKMIHKNNWNRGGGQTGGDGGYSWHKRQRQGEGLQWQNNSEINIFFVEHQNFMDIFLNFIGVLASLLSIPSPVALVICVCFLPVILRPCSLKPSICYV